MTDEEKAIEYCGCNQPICRKGFETKDKENCTCARKKNYLDGFAEGRKELEKVKTELYFYKKDTQELEKENAELKAQIEKMKNCANCKHWIVKLGFNSKCQLNEPCIFGTKDKWELA